MLISRQTPADRRPAQADRAAFTLVEAVVAMAITAVAASALLLGLNAAVQTTGEAEQQAIALGIAQQFLDEIVGNCMVAAGTSASGNGVNRTLWTNIDQFNGVRCQPPLDPWGVPLGRDNGAGGTRDPAFVTSAGFFDRWREEVSVYYVSETDLATRLPVGQTSDYRAVEVRIVYNDSRLGDRELAKARQVVTYVPPMLD